MKKIAMFIAAAAIAVSASAQKTAIVASSVSDNWYIGANAGATTAAKGVSSFDSFDPTFGIRVGKNLTTVFGLALDASAYFNAHKSDCVYKNQTAVSAVEANLLGTANLMNAFAGYKGEPRFFEVIALGGFGWLHAIPSDADAVTTKVALDFAFNLGKNKEWQVYLEPSITYAFAGDVNSFQYDVNNAGVSLRAGFNYKFAGSNGKHNFSVEQLRDQAEIDALNAQINAAKADAAAAKKNAAAEIAKKDAKIAELQKALTECENKPAPVVEAKVANLQPSVVFGQGKSAVENSQLANIQMIANYMKANKDAKVKITGYASPEGNPELNQKLSEKRAEAVKTILVKKYKIAADRLETEGLGATDKLFDEVEFNRVALFNDTTK